MDPGKWVVFGIMFLIGSFLLVSGIKAIRSKKKDVINPDHASASPGILGAIIRSETNKNTPQWQINNQSQTVTVTGVEAIWRGVINLVSSLVLFVFAFGFVYLEMRY